jgi:hypothetical protein
MRSLHLTIFRKPAFRRHALIVLNLRRVFVNVYVQLKIQLDVHVFICILYSSLFLALRVSGIICTHPQEQHIAVGVCNGFDMLIHWSRYWLRRPLNFSTHKKCEGVPASTCSNGLTYQNHYIHLRLYAVPEDGCK